jgi:hypothetical protein
MPVNTENQFMFGGHAHILFWRPDMVQRTWPGALQHSRSRGRIFELPVFDQTLTCRNISHLGCASPFDPKLDWVRSASRQT